MIPHRDLAFYLWNVKAFWHTRGNGGSLQSGKQICLKKQKERIKKISTEMTEVKKRVARRTEREEEAKKEEAGKKVREKKKEIEKYRQRKRRKT
jgi:uncharacterized membrane protein YukC